MSGARIISQASPQILVSMPGWRMAVMVRVQGSFSGGVFTPVAAATSLGCSITSVGSGVFNLNFPACRRIGMFLGNVAPVTVAAAANHRTFSFQSAIDSRAAAGLIVFRTVSLANPPAVADPENGSGMEVTWWADYS